MSTIAAPRKPSQPVGRGPVSSTPSSSSRPSLDDTSGQPLPTRHRAALREYYNLQTTPAPSSDDAPVAPSELDAADFDADAFVQRVLAHQSLSEVLATYERLLAELRALDAERKALVYDNYSKLIAATDTIRRMRESMAARTPVAGTLDVVIERISVKAERLRSHVQETVASPTPTLASASTARRMVREVVQQLLETPERLRCLREDGKLDEASEIWERARKILERWRERDIGGPDVLDCIEDGDAALRGEPPNEKSWARINHNRVTI